MSRVVATHIPLLSVLTAHGKNIIVHLLYNDETIFFKS